MFDSQSIEELVPISHPSVRVLLGTANDADPDQTARRMVRGNQIPHVRIGKRIRVSLPALRKWAAEKMAASVAAEVSTDAQ